MPNNSKTEVAVLDDRLLIDAITEEKNLKPDDQADELNLVDVAPSIANLSLSFKKLGRIENLVGFDSLVKLCLDNNHIEEIVNLGHLKNLKWLDLSFNKIRKIQGLDNLKQLGDLTLFSNKISIVEGLEHCSNLQCLSLGNNRLESMEQVIRLRQLKNLRMLTLSGNPVCKEADYRMSIYAFLDSLKYLDYALIDATERNTAKEQYHDELLDVEEKESVVAEKEARDKALSEFLKKLDEAGILFAHTLIDDMFSGDGDIERLKHLPGIKEAIEMFRNQYKALSDEFVKNAFEKYERKAKEIADFERVVKQVRDREDADSTQLIDNFNRSKRAIINQVTDVRVSMRRSERLSCVKKLNEELDRVCDELLTIEIRQVEKYEGLIDEFDNRMAEAKSQALEMQQVFFRAIEDLEEKFSANIRGIASDLIDRYGREELAEDYLDDEAMGLVVDKDTCLGVVSASHDLHVGKILKREDEARSTETRRYQEMISSRMSFERTRNRDRILQIHEFSRSNKSSLNALVTIDEEEGFDEDEQK